MTTSTRPATVQHDPARATPRRRVPAASVQGTLALDLGRGGGEAVPLHRLSLVPGGRADLDVFAQRFAAAVVEVVGGDRGPSQLLRWTSPEVYADLQRRSALVNRTVPGDRRLRRLRSQVRSVHVSCPAPGAVELSIHVRRGERSRAVAARLVSREGRWCCTALEFG
ncbi:Rv3235 family protein [Nocardioides aurantiacus]|uniref:Rv3235 family protein n=1 Tax=Nocardioides aurantiacus TaxID=86796 RepID=UPI00403F78B0